MTPWLHSFRTLNEDDAGDVQLMFPGDRFPVIAGPNAACINGWRGGIWVSCMSRRRDDFTVEISDGNSHPVGSYLFQS